MEYLIHATRSFDSPNIAWWDGAVSKENLDSLQSLAASSTFKAVVGSGENSKVDSEVRRSTVVWLTYDEAPELYSILGTVVEELNADFFKYDLTGFKEKIQLSNYRAEDRGTYGWHLDRGGNVSRKLSLTMQLSGPEEYEGGELQLNFGGKEPLSVPKKRGLITVFPSWAIHRVSPVTSGSRQSLVAWLSGPEFK